METELKTKGKPLLADSKKSTDDESFINVYKKEYGLFRKISETGHK